MLSDPLQSQHADGFGFWHTFSLWCYLNKYQKIETSQEMGSAEAKVSPNGGYR